MTTWQVNDAERFLGRWLTERERDQILPPDLTGAGDKCLGSWDGWLCTRRAGHTRRHAAGTGIHIIAVWP